MSVKRTWTVARYFFHRVRLRLPEKRLLADKWRRFIYGTPILMYHAFGASTEPASHYVIPARRFARQMAWLKWMGYRVISVQEYLRCRHECSLPPRRSVVITIDDGYADNWSVAYPILRRYRFPATIFVVTNQIGGAYYSHVHSELNGRPMLSWSEIEALTQAGIEIGGHTRSHPDLTKIPSKQAREEIAGSKVDLEGRFDIAVHVFSYPFGKYNEYVQALVQESGFLGACSSNTGLNTPITPLFALRRVEIHGTASLINFALAVCFGERSEILVRRWRAFGSVVYAVAALSRAIQWLLTQQRTR
jgi:peptidoglycan/xylan/chitin deacetylase (PgdA/CDA1 family)